MAARARSVLPGTRTADDGRSAHVPRGAAPKRARPGLGHEPQTNDGAPAALADAGLLRRVQLRDELALEALYDRYGRLVYTLARRIVGDCHLAEEVVQDTFIRCWGGAVQYDAARGRL
ncbi:MAG: hypothetical protein M3442_12310, partial [Chloroflexota bacterium]|nr:hypothetical protein [Chloroflexota bacterium]